MVDDFLKKIQNPKFRGFCVKVEKRFYYYCHTETGEFMWTATNPPPKKKKKPVKGLGLGGGGRKLCHFLHHITWHNLPLMVIIITHNNDQNLPFQSFMWWNDLALAPLKMLLGNVLDNPVLFRVFSIFPHTKNATWILWCVPEVRTRAFLFNVM